MGMTITEKILAVHADEDKVHPGEFLSCRVDIALGNDITAPIAIKQFREAKVDKVFDPAKIALVPDHFTPNKDIASAEHAKILREFAWEHEISHYYEIGKVGIEHVLLPELGVVVPGDIVIGADSHTCTYGALGAFATGVGSTDLAACMATGTAWLRVPDTIKIVFKGTLGPWVSGKDLILFLIGQIGVDGARYNALEFTGPVVDSLGMSDRFTIANMAIESGAKNGIFIPDDVTRAYVSNRAERLYDFYTSDPDASYMRELEYDVSDMEPQVSFPHLPENARPLSEVGTVSIDQAVIGSCTNGRLEDLRIAAEVLKGRQVDSRVRLIILPGTQQVYLDAVKEGLVETFITAGGVMSPPTCGPCLGGHMGILAKDEKAIATTNRNFVGRMGHPESEVYLSNPAIAAASAVLGRIGSPDEL